MSTLVALMVECNRWSAGQVRAGVLLCATVGCAGALAGCTAQASGGEPTKVTSAAQTAVVAVSVEGEFPPEADNGCYLDAVGSVACWQGLALGSSEPSDSYFPGDPSTPFTPVHVDLPKAAVAIATAFYSACAVLEDSTVWCWGQDYLGDLGPNVPIDGASAKPVEIVLPPNLLHSDSIPILATNISGKFGHYCVTSTEGGAWCWGEGDHGELGNGDGTNSPVPVTPKGLGPGSNVISVSAGEEYSCALLSGSGGPQLECWGDGMSGQLGNSLDGSSQTPVDVYAGGLSSPAQVAAGQLSTCAVGSNGWLWCWGDDIAGELGNGMSGNDSDPYPSFAIPQLVRTPAGAFSQVAVGILDACGRQDTSLYCWGVVSPSNSAVSTPKLLPTGGDRVSTFAMGLSICWVNESGIARCRDGNGIIHAL